MKTLLQVSLRQNAIYIPSKSIKQNAKNMTETTSALSANVARLGFTFSEKLLHALNGLSPTYKLGILESLKEVTGVKKNWTPLVKGWEVPTGETVLDHIITLFSNAFKHKKGTTLPCGHLIPNNTFPLERYNGCPFCGTPFQFGEIELMGQGSKLKTLDLWTEGEARTFFKDLLISKTALDATQIDSLKILMDHFELPVVHIGMKETSMLVVDILVEKEEPQKAQSFFHSPTDILRYLWYKKTGLLQIVEPKTLIKRREANFTHIYWPLSNGKNVGLKKKEALKLKYTRKECRITAQWLNNLELTAEKACEIMHPKRRMWIRFIRALRLAEYSKKKGFEKLARLMDVFYRQGYPVWQGQVDRARYQFEADVTFNLLKQRPGVFARSLFANMLWFGAESTSSAFAEIVDKVPARLLFTLSMYAQNYFDPSIQRSVKPLGGTRKRIGANPLLELYTKAQLKDMKRKVEDLCLLAIKKRFTKVANSANSMYIDPMLFNIPLAIGERSDNVQDLPIALMGTRFPVDGNEVRLFMQWGEGLPAQHLDMDLSCHIAYEAKKDICSYSQLTTKGCQHSGDIRSIPNKKGTAEYIKLNIPELEAAGAYFVTFTCNAYSNGSLSPNLTVGWMDSKYRMHISERTGVSYDPSCVQHQVRITQKLTKGLVFGVLDVMAREIVWLEMSFAGQIVQGLDFKGVQALLSKLNSRLNIGALLRLKAKAQGLKIVDTPAADEVYDMEWARNTAAVTQLLID